MKLCEHELFIRQIDILSKIISTKSDMMFKRFCCNQLYHLLQSYDKYVEQMYKRYPNFICDLKHDIHLICVALKEMIGLAATVNSLESTDEIYQILYQFCRTKISEMYSLCSHIDEKEKELKSV